MLAETAIGPARVTIGFAASARRNRSATRPASRGLAALSDHRAKDDWTQLYTEEYRGLRRMRKAYASIGETARQQGVPGVVALFPDLRDLTRYDEYCHPRIRPRIAEAVESAGLTLIDLEEDFLPYARRETEIAIGANIGSSHPNAAGYELIAQALARELIARGLVPTPVVTAGGAAAREAAHP
jgi:hypothetical protein